MSLLERVEQRLGLINTWPTSIIRILFVNTFFPTIVKKLTAFMIDNVVDLFVAIDLYLLCNDEWHRRFRHDMYHFNFIWQRQMHNIHLCK
jgi:hypothetical protein